MIYQLNHAYYVRALNLDDLDGPYPSWFEDQQVCQYNNHGKFFKSKAELESFIANISNRQELVWAICHDKDGHIGNVSLQSINWINRSAEFAILMGNKAHWNKGAAFLASNQLVKHGFEKLNLHRIYCGTAATNQGMIKLASKLHMTQEGLRRQHLFLEGHWCDMLEFGVLKEEFAM